MIEHPNYIAGSELCRRTQKDPFFRTDEKSQFSPDITPLILAAHYNNHEIIQMFLSRNQTIDRPHPISCQCADCVTKQVFVKSCHSCESNVKHETENGLENTSD